MRSSIATIFSPKGLLFGLAAVLAVFCLRSVVEGEDQAEVQSDIARAEAGVPTKYANIYARLNRRIALNFEKASFDEVFEYLQKELGKPISLDDAEFDRSQAASEITLQAPAPITVKAALRAFMNYTVLHSHQIALAEDEVRLLSADKAQGKHVLQTYDLRFISSYSTKLREQLIVEIMRDTTPRAWGKEDGAWMTAGTSVFSIDAYHTPEVHLKIGEGLQKKYRIAWHNHVGLRRFTPYEERTPEENKQRAKELQAQFSFESLAPRLTYEEGKAAKPAALSPKAQQRLAQSDKQYDEMRKSNHHWFNLRRASLVKLHGDEVEKFIAREGFGLTRMPSPSPSFLELPPVPQFALPSGEIDPPHAEPVANLPQSAADPAAVEARFPTSNKLAGLHISSEASFLSPDRMGYAKNRDEVAGFGSHAFNRLPRLIDSDNWLSEPTEHWAMRRMELVSLLKHEKPQVYVSDELPRMDKLGEAATRDLDLFEADALDKLSAGEDVVTRASLNRIEMLGALRASKACLECHSVEHGQLLGAFSYSLVRDPLLKTDDRPVH